VIDQLLQLQSFMTIVYGRPFRRRFSSGPEVPWKFLQKHFFTTKKMKQICLYL